MESVSEREGAVAEAPGAPPVRTARMSAARALLVAMRPPEWIKNLLVYAGLLFSQQFDDPGRVLDATLAFVAFCAISSAGYLINDLRVVAGAVAVDAHASEWLLVCTGMLALFLGFTKRRQEAMEEQESMPAASSASRPGTAGSRVTRPVLEHYSLPFLDQMVSMVTAAAIISYAVYAVDSPRIGSEMLATAPSVLYGIFRYLYLIYDRRDTRSTAAILTRDPGMILAGVTWVG